MWRLFALFALGLFFGGRSTQAQDDPCSPGGYTVLNQTYRSTGYDTRSTDTPYCDDKLPQKWYTFIDLDGQAVQIPETCVQNYRCGTVIPLHISGFHPSVSDGIVHCTVCGKLNTQDPFADCCAYKDTISVKNCGTFYVYLLNPTKNCPSGYCAGNRKRCTEDQLSATGYEPCRDKAPVLESKPLTLGPYVTRESFEFKCKIEIQSEDADQVFEVTWTFDNQTDPAIGNQILTGAQRVATLTGDLLRAHTDKHIQCTVRTYYQATPSVRYIYYGTIIVFGVQDISLPAPVLQGTDSFNFQSQITAGSTDASIIIHLIWTFDGVQDPNLGPWILTGEERIATLEGTALIEHFNSKISCMARLLFPQVDLTTAFVKSSAFFAGIQKSSEVIEIKSSDIEKTVYVTSTVPVVCDSGDKCCLSFQTSLDKKLFVSLKDSCSSKICLSDWNPDTNQASASITIVPNRNTALYTATKVKMSFSQMEVSGSGLYREALGNYVPDEIEIDPEPEPSENCSVTGDPHFKLPTNLAISYDLYQTGDYTVYLVEERDFIVQIRTWKCGNVACICGVAVRERNNIIRVHGCDKPGNVAAASLDIAYPLSPGTTVQRSGDGKHIGMLFSSGSSVKIDLGTTMTDVYISTPAVDKATRKGACGTPMKGKEFTHPDGTVTPVCSGSGRCIPVSFTESWRVRGNASLFVIAPDLVAEELPQQYCSCSLDSQGKLVSVCSPRQHIQDNIIVCSKCRTVTPVPFPWGHPGHEEKPWEHKPLPPVDPNQEWPNAEGTTEDQAKNLCLTAIRKSPLYEKCQNMQSLISSTLDQCMGDILNGGTSEFVSGATDIFTSFCLSEQSKNESNYAPGPDGTPCLKPDVVIICSADCEDHGQCGDDGTCVCQSGWAGESCQIDIGKGPQINRTEGLVCHDDQKPCESVECETSNVEIFEKLTCHVQAVDEKGNKIGNPLIANATSVPSPSVTCPLPQTVNATQKFNVSVCTENGKCGNELTITVYDPACLQCDNSGCQIKSSTCNIDNKCYKDLEKNPQNEKQVCNSRISQTSWTGGCTDLPNLEEIKDHMKQVCELLSVNDEL